MKTNLEIPWWLAVCAGLSACGGEPPRPPRLPPPPPAAQPEPDYLEYVPSPDLGLTLVDGDVTAVLGRTHRAVFARGKLPKVLPSYGLQAQRKVPARLGGGWVLWGGRTLVRADAWDAPFVGLRAFGDDVRAVSPHPDGLLVHLASGGSVLVDAKTGARKPLAPLGVRDVAASEDGRGLALLAVGDLALREPGGDWRPLAAPAAVEHVGVEVVEGTEELTLRALGRTFLAPRGAQPLREVLRPPSRSAEPPKRLGVDPSWSDSLTPLSRAISSGVPLRPGVALVASEGNLYGVSLLDGSIQSVRRSVYPPELSCRLWTPRPRAAVPAAPPADFAPPAADGVRSPFEAPPKPAADAPTEVLLLCAGLQASLVLSGLRAEPRTEKVLPGGGQFTLGADGSLAYVSRLPEPPPAKKEPGAKDSPGPSPRQLANRRGVWLRTSGGTWTDLGDVGPAIEAIAPAPKATDDKPEEVKPAPPPLPPSPPGRRPKRPEPAKPPEKLEAGPVFLRAVPSDAGVTIFVAAGEGLHRLELPKGSQQALDLAGLDANGRRSLAVWLRDTLPFDGGVWATPGGQRLLGNGAPSLILDGAAVTPAPRAFVPIVSWGPRALGWVQNKLFQTVDGGERWDEIAAPPEAQHQGATCSEVGCWFGGWLRFGWRATAPGGPPERAAALGAPADDAGAPRPSLRCTPVGKPTRKERAPNPDGRTLVGLGASDLGAFPEGTIPVAFARSQGVTPSSGAFDTLAVFVLAPPPDEPRPGAVRPDAKLQAMDAFDPEGVVRTLALKDATVQALYTQHQPLDSFGGWRDTSGWGTTFLPVTPQVGVKSPPLAVLGLAPGPNGGPVVRWDGKGGAPIWDPTSVAQPRSAIHKASGTLVLRDNGHLARLGDHGGLRVRALPDAALEETDVLGVAADGVVHLVRTNGVGGPPTAYQPALAFPLFAADDAPLALATAKARTLAAWSTLTLASDPACKADKGIRVLVTSSASWIRAPEIDADDDASMRALVRWSEQRVCLDAVEIVPQGADDTAEVLVARWDEAKPRAALVRTAQGLEARAPRACELER